MDENLFNTDEMSALLEQLNSEKLKKASEEVSENTPMSKEMEASQRRYEEIIKKQNQTN